MQAQMGKHVPVLLDRWRNEYEPEARAINDDTLNGDYNKLGDREVSELLETVVQKREREGELHFLAVFPAMGAVMFYEQVYGELFGEPDAGEHLQLLQGFANKSVEVGNGLWQLAMEARRRPQVMAMLQRMEPSSMHQALLTDPEGRAFRGAVEEFLRKYGWRGNELDVAAPTWAEDPTITYKMIREYASRDDYNPEDEFRSLVAAREAREQVLVDRLGGLPAAGDVPAGACRRSAVPAGAGGSQLLDRPAGDRGGARPRLGRGEKADRGEPPRRARRRLL